MRQEKNLNIYVSFCNNFHSSVFAFAFVINFRNCKETFMISPVRRLLHAEKSLVRQLDSPRKCDDEIINEQRRQLK